MKQVGIYRSGHCQYRRVGNKYWGQLPSGEIHEYNTLEQFLDACKKENDYYDSLAHRQEEITDGKQVLLNEWLIHA